MKIAEEYFREHRLRYFHTLTKNQVIGLMESYAKEHSIEFLRWFNEQPIPVDRIVEWDEWDEWYEEWIKDK